MLRGDGRCRPSRLPNESLKLTGAGHSEVRDVRENLDAIITYLALVGLQLSVGVRRQPIITARSRRFG